MRTPLEVESAELAAALRALEPPAQARLARAMVERAVAEQDPPLALPPEPDALAALADGLDASEDERDFRRARAAMAEQSLRQAAYEDALYEAIHARWLIPEAVQEALDALPYV